MYGQQVNDIARGSFENNWAFQIKSLLDELGFTYIWLEMVIQCVYDQYFQNWYGSVNASSKLEVVKCTNKVFHFEKYLKCIKTDSHRIALARLRCSAHKLAIEEGRLRNIERSLRLCQFCNSGVIEDEFHFLLACPAYRELRTSILPRYYCRWPTKQKFIKLLNETQACILKKSWKVCIFSK